MDARAFRDRMQRACMIDLRVQSILRRRVGQICSVRPRVALSRAAASAPTLPATAAFLYGRQYGHRECGAIERINLPDQEAMKAELKGRPDLKEQLDEVREVS